MFCRTETSWSYWSLGEASFFIRLSWMKTESWTMLGYGGIGIVIRRILGSGALRFKMRAGTLPTSFFWVVGLATGPAIGISFLLSTFALLGIFLFLFFTFSQSLTILPFSLQILQVISDVCSVDRGVSGLDDEELIVAMGRSSDSSRALSSSSLFK